MLGGTPLVDCFAFWRSRRDGRPVPLKAAIDPVLMPQRIIPHLFLYNQTPDGRFRCRLAGTAVCDAFQNNPTGRHLDELILPERRESRQRLFQDVVERALPVAYSGNVAEAGRTWIKFRRLMLPISFGSERADGIFGMVVFPGFELRRSSPKLVDHGGPESVAWASDADLAFDE
jgi:hypothetical protein